MFFSTYATSSSTKDVSFDKSNKWTGKTGKNFVEGELDVSYIAAFAPGVKTLVANPNISAATESGEGFGAALLAFLVELNSRDSVPNVLSMSLGSLSFGSCDKMCNALVQKGGHTYEACWSYLQTQFQACMFDSEAVEQRIDAELAKLGLRGTTITAASGDGASHFAFGPFSGGIGDDLNAIICNKMNCPFIRRRLRMCSLSVVRSGHQTIFMDLSAHRRSLAAGQTVVLDSPGVTRSQAFRTTSHLPT